MLELIQLLDDDIKFVAKNKYTDKFRKKNEEKAYGGNELTCIEKEVEWVQDKLQKFEIQKKK
jgi:hypothetical protein